MCGIAWLYVHAIAASVSAICGYKFPSWQPLVVGAVNLLNHEWIHASLILLSGVISFGTAAIVYRSVETMDQEPPNRLRCGAAALKQAVRRHKAQSHPHCRKPSHAQKPLYCIPAPLEQANIYYHPRFNNLSRLNRSELPNLKWIQYIKLRT